MTERAISPGPSVRLLEDYVAIDIPAADEPEVCIPLRIRLI